MGIVVIGAVFVDIKGYPLSTYIPGGRNAGRVEQVHGGVCRNVAEDIANVELRPTFVSLVDDTGSGQDVIDKLAKHKVNTKYIEKVPDGMGTWLAVFDNDGDVCAAISKRPDTTPLTRLLEEKGDEIFADCDGIAFELDLEKDTVKQILRCAKKYNKKVYAAISNMSIAMERRAFLQEIDCFVCNQQEAGLLFSDEYDHMAPEEMCRTLAANVHSANIPCMVVTMGGEGAVYARSNGESGVVPAKGGCHRHHRRGGRLLRRYGHRPDLRQDTAGSLRDRQPFGGLGHLHGRECLPPVPPAGVWAEHPRGGLKHSISKNTAVYAIYGHTAVSFVRLCAAFQQIERGGDEQQRQRQFDDAPNEQAHHHQRQSQPNRNKAANEIICIHSFVVNTIIHAYLLHKQDKISKITALFFPVERNYGASDSLL